MLPILGTCIESKEFSSGKRSMAMHISGRQIDNLGRLSSWNVTSCGGCHSRQRWHRLWSWLSASVQLSCSCSFVSPPCLRILWGAILAMNISRSVVLMKHSWVSFYRSLHLFMPRKFNTPPAIFIDLSTRLFNQTLRFLYCATWKPSFAHFCHIQDQEHVRLFQLYPTSLPYHNSRHVENLQEISCCF